MHNVHREVILELRAQLSLSRLWQQQGKRGAPLSSWHPSMPGFPRALTRLISKRARR